MSFSVPDNFIWCSYLFFLKVDSISYMLSQFHSLQACKSHSDHTLEIHGADLDNSAASLLCLKCINLSKIQLQLLFLVDIRPVPSFFGGF